MDPGLDFTVYVYTSLGHLTAERCVKADSPAGYIMDPLQLVHLQ